MKKKGENNGVEMLTGKICRKEVNREARRTREREGPSNETAYYFFKMSSKKKKGWRRLVDEGRETAARDPHSETRQTSRNLPVDKEED